ncbi:hypothetical protein [Lysobacter antibioticus]|uniref:hypothetical protein n=1 Tax=Lysobacter antibioticus TaxID=84531 RepID=UPI00146FCF06|nr:hypothetical protein [Lysobacter antibioticus]
MTGEPAGIDSSCVSTMATTSAGADESLTIVLVMRKLAPSLVNRLGLHRNRWRT